jgi:predicted RNA-binding protein Jag
MFENNDKGLCNTKKNEAPFKIGEDCEYDITENTAKNGTSKWFKIKKVDKMQQGKKNFDPTVKIKSFAVSYANRFVLQDLVPRPTGDKLENETSEEWNKFLSIISKYAKSFYKEMKFDMDAYGFSNADIIGVALSNAIDARLQGKIRRDMLFPYYRNLLDSVLVKQVAPQSEQK